MKIPSKNICITHQFSDSVYYVAQCECTSDHDQQTLTLERDKDFGISLSIYSKIHTKYHWPKYEDSRLDRAWNWVKWQGRKVKMAFDLLTKGYLEAENEYLFGNKQAIRDYIDALEYGLQELSKKEK